MDQIIQEIVRKYRDYKARVKSVFGRPLPGALALVAILLFPPLAAPAAEATNPYYGDEFYSALYLGMRDANLVSVIRKVLESGHRRRAGQTDEMTSSCDPAARDCYGHVSIGYTTARKAIMGLLYLQGTPGNYFIHDVYCERDYTNADFGRQVPAPRQAPDDTVLNVEHTWPQSRFNPRMNRDAQKSDLHHLYPSDSEMNSARGNLWFAEITTPTRKLRCPQNRIGFVNGLNDEFFEPPAAHRGHIARALFYFSIRYHIPISQFEEAVLRKWHREYPVDAFEFARNDAVMRIQGNRNPFIDYPQLADLISRFAN
jgi:hypothetical protein